ncbi:hypothetical protein [Gemmata sp.]|uniref:hypothetical protein n=1 Tax=Gemmata sp. TaxID=1914242 RepID=UPI003F6F15D4
MTAFPSPLGLGILAVATCSLLASCSGGGPQTATVTGKVTYNGRPVTAGSLTFLPKTQATGRPASGVISEAGEYFTGTFNERDGVLIGVAAVSYAPPPIDNKGEKIVYGAPPPQGPYDGLVVKVREVEIAPGSNVIDVELIPATKP